jgi:hypothetical protein
MTAMMAHQMMEQRAGFLSASHPADPTLSLPALIFLHANRMRQRTWDACACLSVVCVICDSVLLLLCPGVCAYSVSVSEGSSNKLLGAIACAIGIRTGEQRAGQQLRRGRVRRIL